MKQATYYYILASWKERGNRMAQKVYEMVTNRIIEELEKGTIPWNRPWFGSPNGAFNRVSKQPYSLINQILLLHDGEYATFKQWSALGGKIRKGEKSEIVIFWKMEQKEIVNDDGEKETRQIPLLRYYNVFHISQVDGVEPLAINHSTTHEPIAEAERIKEEYKTREQIKIIETLSNQAFYNPTLDFIQVPQKEQYKDVHEFYSTLFHEMIHSTGAKTRLDRFEPGAKNAAFGSEEYSKEELVAEIGSATILNLLGIETTKTFKNSAAYIQSWLRVLKNDPRFIVSASARAEKAVKYILAND